MIERLTLMAATMIVLASCTSGTSGDGSAPSRTASSSPTRFPPPRQTSPTVYDLLHRLDGNWSGHGRSLSLKAGAGLIDYRVYKSCTDDPTPPCDEMQGNEIIDGGRIEIRLTTAYMAGTATIAQGNLVSSTDPSIPTGPITARDFDHLLTLSVFPGAPFCDAQSAARSECGA